MSVAGEAWMRRGAAVTLGAVLLLGSLVIAGEATTPGNTSGHLQVGPLDVPVDVVLFAKNRLLSGALAIVSVLSLLGLAAATRTGRERLARVAFVVLALAVTGAGAVAVCRSAIARPEAFDVRDDFLYYMGTKYFPEVGYFDHLECALWAEHEAGGRLPVEFRSMRDNHMQSSRALIAAGAPACRAAFSDARWRAFAADQAFFVSRLRPWKQWDIMFKDHGFNGTPVLRALIAACARVFPAGHASLTLLGFVNLGVMALALAAVLRWVGWREAFVLALLLFTYSGDGFGHLMAIPRYVWLATLVGGVTALHRHRLGWAAALLTVSASLKLFPVLWLAGPLLVLSVRSLRAPTLEDKTQARRDLRVFALVAGAVGTLLFAWTLLGGHGLQDWAGFFHKMDLNGTRLATARVGFKFNWLRPILGEPSYDRALDNFRAPLLLGVRLRDLELLVALALTAVAARRCLRVSLAQASVLLGFTLLFVFLGPVRYYYAALLGVSLLFVFDRQPRAFLATASALLSISALGCLLHRSLSERAQYNIQYSVSLTVFLVGLLVIWELADRRAKLDPARPSEVR